MERESALVPLPMVGANCINGSRLLRADATTS